MREKVGWGPVIEGLATCVGLIFAVSGALWAPSTTVRWLFVATAVSMVVAGTVATQERIMYLQLKTRYDLDHGPAWDCPREVEASEAFLRGAPLPGRAPG